MTELETRIAEIEAFEKTPAGAALKRYRVAIQLAWMADTPDQPIADRHWQACRAAEQELIAEIKKLQEKAA